MIITSGRMHLLNKDNRVVAVVSFTFDDMFAVHDLRLLSDEKETFIVMPSRKTSDGNYKDIFYPINNDARLAIEGIASGIYNYCVENNVKKTVWKVKEGFSGDLRTQTFSDFELEE